ncbi:MAG: sugar phosphate isomerase/epimerase family protein [Spirochaetota bacterium]
MFKCLNVGMLDQKASPEGSIALASRFGYGGIDCSLKSVVDDGAFLTMLDEAKIKRGVCGGLLPGNCSVPDAEWNTAMDALPLLAKRARTLGFTRTTLVILPFHEKLPFDENMKMHIDRVTLCVPMLAEHGIRVGLEYVAQKTRRAGYPHEFIYDMKGLLRMIAASGTSAGVLLDAFHWFCARETGDDITKLTNKQIVAVHVSDAVRGRPIDEQIAFERELPGATGEIDIRGFINALSSINYDGPVTAEPMNALLRSMPIDDAIQVTAAAMTKIIGV